jgi:hypothetical protein
MRRHDYCDSRSRHARVGAHHRAEIMSERWSRRHELADMNCVCAPSFTARISCATFARHLYKKRASDTRILRKSYANGGTARPSCGTKERAPEDVSFGPSVSKWPSSAIILNPEMGVNLDEAWGTWLSGWQAPNLIQCANLTALSTAFVAWIQLVLRLNTYLSKVCRMICISRQMSVV